MKIIEYFKKFEKTIDFIKRNSIIIILLILGLYFLGFVNEFAKLIYSIIAIAGLNILIANISVFTFTKINFTDTENSKYKFMVIGLVYLGTSILIAGSIFGMYYIYFYK
jgi:hypothetical protein